MSRLILLYQDLVALLQRSAALGPLPIRLLFGWFWVETGWAKLHNLEGFAGRFEAWGIPFPTLSATLSGATDLVGGALMMLGLATRLTMLPMAFNMVVALALVVLPTISGFNEFVELDEVLYLLIFILLFWTGPGAISLDALIAKRLQRNI